MYTHNFCQKNTGTYRPEATYFLILFANVKVYETGNLRYFIPSYMLKMKYAKIQNTTDEQTITIIVNQKIHRTLGNIVS